MAKMRSLDNIRLDAKPMKTGAVVGMTYEIIAQNLKLGDDYKIVSAWVDPARELLYVRVEGPGLPETPEGQEYIHVSPAFYEDGTLAGVSFDRSN